MPPSFQCLLHKQLRDNVRVFAQKQGKKNKTQKNTKTSIVSIWIGEWGSKVGLGTLPIYLEFLGRGDLFWPFWFFILNWLLFQAFSGKLWNQASPTQNEPFWSIWKAAFFETFLLPRIWKCHISFQDEQKPDFKLSKSFAKQNFCLFHSSKINFSLKGCRVA